MKLKHLLAFHAIVLTFIVSANSYNDSLKQIILQNRKLFELPQNINYKEIKSLDVRYNSIRSFPEELRLAQNLEELDASFNKVINIELTADQIKLLKIKHLHLNECNLLYLPFSLSEMKQLEHLSASNNYIKELPEELCQKLQLSTLDLAGNKITYLPKELKELKSLSHLNLSGNPCLNDDKTFLQLSQLENLKEIIVRNSGTFHSSLLRNQNLRLLDISNSTFATLNVNEKNAHQLSTLLASNCNALNFTTLLPLLKSGTLKTIEIGGESFTGFVMAELSPSLEKLVLSGKTLVNYQIRNKLTLLQELDLKFEQIDCLDKIVSNLADENAIKKLDLAGNNITFLPTAFSKLKTLQYLDLRGNEIRNPQVLYSLKQLAELNISGCALDLRQINKLKEELPDTKIINTVATKLAIEGREKSRETFTVDAQNPGTIITSNGTEIRIPSNSLLTKDGNPVKGPVTVNYTTFYSLGSIAASGINMNYTENGITMPFKSAGMFELTATTEGKNIELKKGKQIQVSFKSIDSTDSYKYYVYDSIKQTWKESGQDSVKRIKVVKAVSKSNSDSLAARFNSINALPTRMNFIQPMSIYMKWRVSGDKKGTFTLSSESNKKENSDTTKALNYLFEMNVLRNIRWKVEGQDYLLAKKNLLIASGNALFNVYEPYKFITINNEKNKSLYSKNNMEVNLEIIADREHDNFILMFYSKKDTICIHAYPDFDTRNVDKIQKRTKALYEEYQKEQDKRELITQKRKNRFRREYSKFVLNANFTRNQMFEDYTKSIDALMASKVNTASYDITRFLSISGFGVHNCDHPLPVEDPVILAAKFIDDKGHRITAGTANFIDVKTNLATNIYAGMKGQVPSNSVLTVVMSNGKSTYIGKYSTLGLKGKVGTVDIKLSKTPADFTIADLDKYINNLP